MKKSILGLLLFTSIIACSKKEETPNGTTPQLQSSWIMKAYYMDPGDGSGSFTPVNSSKYIKFYTNGTLSSNGDLCSMDSSAANPTSGTFSAADSTFVSSGCAVSTWSIQYSIDGDTLDVYYPCIEACVARYVATP